MCCLPIKYMQFFVILIACIMVLVGVAVIVAAAYSRSNQFMLYVGDSRSVFIVGLVFGIVLILICFVGICGACQKNRCCLLIFGIVIFVVMIVLIALSAIVYIVKDNASKYYKDYNCESTSSYITDLNEAQGLAQLSFCVKDVCPCDYEYTPLSDQMAISPDGSKSVQECNEFPSDKKTAANLIGIVEYLFNCRGICKAPPLNIFYFSNINNHDGKPEQKLCSDDIWEFIKKSASVVGGICVGMSVISFLAFLSLCGICCHPKREEYWEVSGDRI